MHDLENMVPIVSFYGDVMDDELEKLTLFLEHLSKKKDFRKTMMKSFQLQSFLEEKSLQDVVNNLLSQSKLHQEKLIYN